jgi:tetratricopeptide (TPR) repeat protein
MYVNLASNRKRGTTEWCDTVIKVTALGTNKEIQRVCFVVMGFGKKTDYESGRTLDLDATYEAIIKPAVIAAGLRCIRSDELIHSGVIDTEMYTLLLRAELVVADISTGNVNAIYELGVRHALRPHSTIIMKEALGKLYFDLDHVNTFEYQHLGEDIGAREAKRACDALSKLISSALEGSKPDSPVYTFLPSLRQPQLSDTEYAQLLDETEASQEKFSSILSQAENSIKESRMEDAAGLFSEIDSMRPEEPYIVQQLALSTYKAKQPSELEALISGLSIIGRLAPDTSNDPETLGITAAIRKRLWLLTGDQIQLEKAIRFYRRGFEVRRDYYNGENLALCLELRAKAQSDVMERQYDEMSAKKVRDEIIVLLTELVATDSFQDRSDRKWIYATLASCFYKNQIIDLAQEYERKFMDEGPAVWEVETYNSSKQLN